MRRIVFVLVAVAALAGLVAAIAPASGQSDGGAAQTSYRIPRLEADLRGPCRGQPQRLRAKLGNDVAIKAYQEGKLPFLEGTIIARLTYRKVTWEKDHIDVRGILEGRGLQPEQVTKLLAESFVAGPASNVQFMVKDSKKYPSTASWGFAQFTDGKP